MCMDQKQPSVHCAIQCVGESDKDNGSPRDVRKVLKNVNFKSPRSILFNSIFKCCFFFRVQVKEIGMMYLKHLKNLAKISYINNYIFNSHQPKRFTCMQELRNYYVNILGNPLEIRVQTMEMTKNGSEQLTVGLILNES